MHLLLRVLSSCLVTFLLVFGSARCSAQEASDSLDQDLLDASEWRRIDGAVDKSLRWLAKKQNPDGSFPTHVGGQPGVTSLCVMAFAAHGHLPGEGPFGDQLIKAVDFINRCQKRSGLIALAVPNSAQIPRNVGRDTSNNAVYNHAISATVLSELYGLALRNKEQEEIIEKAIEASLVMQHWPKQTEAELGGWRYLSKAPHDGYQSDLSVTAWALMFLRSAKNCGFDVPQERIDEGVQYVLNTFSEKQGTFHLFDRDTSSTSRAMAGAGIMALAHSGVHNRPENRRAAEYMLKYPCLPYGQDDPQGLGTAWYPDRYHYSAFLATQAMYQMGGSYWERHFPPTAKALLENQLPQGSWPPEKHQYDARFGNAYTTALVVLTLGAPNQLLPVFQR